MSCSPARAGRLLAALEELHALDDALLDTISSRPCAGESLDCHVRFKDIFMNIDQSSSILPVKWNQIDRLCKVLIPDSGLLPGRARTAREAPPGRPLSGGPVRSTTQSSSPVGLRELQSGKCAEAKPTTASVSSDRFLLCCYFVLPSFSSRLSREIIDCLRFLDISLIGVTR